MLTIEALKAYGANTAEGLNRCMNNEAFYLRLVGMLKADTHMEELRKAVEAGNLKAGFEAAHALKGVLSNLALTPALKPVSEITELLRAGAETDYAPLLAEASAQMDALLRLMED